MKDNICFGAGDTVEIIADNSSHFIPIGTVVTIRVVLSESHFRVDYEDEFWSIGPYDIRIIEKDIDSINAEIQAALNPSIYQDLTAFNREPQYEGGGFKLPNVKPSNVAHG